MRRRLTLIGSWAVGTLLAIMLASLAVQLAGAKVTERPGATISRKQIEQDLASRSTPSTETSTTSTSTTAPVSDDPGEDPPGAGVPAPSTTTPRVVTPSTTPAAPAPTTLPSTPPPTFDDRRSPSPGSPGGPPAPAPTTTAVASSEQTFVLVGGSVRVRCDGAVVRLVSSAPAAGFVMEVHNPGPGQTVEVRFESDDHRSELKVTCAAGVITAEPREQAS